MAYNLIITDRADESIDRIVIYLLHKLCNSNAAVHLLDEIDSIYDRLEKNPFQFPDSRDERLARKGYREALLSTMDYRIVFRVDIKTIYIVGAFHILEDHVQKINLWEK